MAYRLRIDVLATTVLTIAACGLAIAPSGSALFAPGSAQAQMPDPCQGVVGRWNWFVNNGPAVAEVTILPGGTLTHGDRKGKWFCAESRFILTWDHGFTDILSLSMDGGRLTGKNNAGDSVNGEKIAAVIPRPGQSIVDFERSPAKPPPPPASAPPPRSRVLGLDLAPLTDDLRRRFQISGTVSSGLVVLGVDAGSSASGMRLGPGDVIMELAHDRVSRVDEILAQVERHRKEKRHAILMLVATATGETRFVAIRIPDAAAPDPPSAASRSATGQQGQVSDPQLDELLRDFFPRSAPPPASVPSQTAQASPREQDGGWSKHQATVTLRAFADNPNRGFLGIQIGGSEHIFEALRLGRKAGVLVVYLRQDSPSEGVLQRGDIIVAANGRATNNPAELVNAVTRLMPGMPVVLEFWRYAGGFPQLQAALFARAQLNDAPATYVLGFLERNFGAGEPNHARAFGFFHRAAALGHLQAMEETGHAYRDGLGTEKNPPEAAKWYRRAAEAGSTVSMAGIAQLIEDGILGPADPPEAFRWMQRAAVGGHVAASYHLARYYDTGHGTAQDREAGARHLIEAARTGPPELVTHISSATAKWRPSADLVSALQRRLIEAGTYKGPVDGKLSPDLTAALTRLQRGSAQ